MPLQKTVNQKLAFGVVGSFYDDSPRRVDPYTVAGGAIGLFYTVDPADPSKVKLGGTGVLAGVAVNSKEYTITGLDASLAFRAGDIAEICSMGRVIVKSTTAITVGNSAYYNKTTGEIQAAAPSSTIDGFVEIPDSMFVLVGGTAGEVGVLQLG